jgi:hypothetical protein
MVQTRLNNYVRVAVNDSGRLSISTRSGTSRSDHFGDAQSLSLAPEEARALRDLLNEHLPDDDEDA